MSKATLKVSIAGQPILVMDVIQSIELRQYQGEKVTGSIIDLSKCDFELEVITHNGVEELKAIYALDPPPVYEE